MLPTQLWALECTPLLSQYCKEHILTFCSIIFAVLYWYVWTVALPRWRGYTLEEELEVLSDGTSITKLVHSTPL